MSDADPGPRAAVPFLRFDREGDGDGQPFLQGSRCRRCGTVAPGERPVCIACGGRGTPEPIRLAEQGRLYSYTIVHRSFPGVQTPFVAAIVDLDGGGSIKGTLIDVAPEPEALPFDMPVRVVFRDSGQKAADGAPFLCYYFTPAGEAS